MEQLNYSQNDLAEVIGLKSRASKILNRKRKLSLGYDQKADGKAAYSFGGFNSGVLVRAAEGSKAYMTES